MSKIKPKIIRVNSENLQLDKQNPRLPESVQNSGLNKIWEHMKNSYDLDELALSMVENGYFEAEPMVAIPKDVEFSDKESESFDKFRENEDSKYIVVEGNRRLSTIQGLLNSKLKYEVPDSFLEEVKELPILLYPNRSDVLAFLGVHHLLGVRKWNVYERAKFIVSLKRKKHMSIDSIQKAIGDRKNSARKIYVCYRLIELLSEYDDSINLKDAKERFSFLQLATGQTAIRKFIGLSSWVDIDNVEQPISEDKLEDLKFLFTCMFDNGSTRALIKESREITNKLSKILNDDAAIEILRRTLSIDIAFNMIGGELIGMNKLSDQAKRNLEEVNGKLSGMDIEKDVLAHKEGEMLEEIAKAMVNISSDIVRKFEN
jgi:hypothetical protein